MRLTISPEARSWHLLDLFWRWRFWVLVFVVTALFIHAYVILILIFEPLSFDFEFLRSLFCFISFDMNHLDFTFLDQLVFSTNMLILELISQRTILDLNLKVWSWACGYESDLAGIGLQPWRLYLHFNVSNKQQIWTKVSLSLCWIRLQ